MRLELVTPVLDAMPWLAVQFANYQQLKCQWRVWIIEGAAMNVHCTKWCQPQEPRLSRDGTSEFVQGIRSHPRVRVIQKQSWQGKLEMMNAPLPFITERAVLVQADSDEIWTADQLEKLLRLFEAQPQSNCARFYCRYFLGPNIIATSRNGYGNKAPEWLRAFRFEPGMKWRSHEPPCLAGINEPGKERCMDRDLTAKMGLVFDHAAWFLPKQARFKMDFYGYPNALGHWQRLQRNTVWPVKNLEAFLPWCGPNASADLLHKP